MWFQVEGAMPRHKKTRRLAKKLVVSRATATGLLISLWAWCLDNAPDGNLEDCTEDEIAAAAGWEDPDTHKFVKALQDTGWLDDRAVHDWADHGGKSVVRSATNAARNREWRAKRKGVIVTQPSQSASVDTLETEIHTEDKQTDMSVVFKLWETDIKQMLTPWVAQGLEADCKEYGQDWVVDALKEACRREKRSLAYIQGILKGWKRDGRGPKETSKPTPKVAYQGMSYE
jgi:DnaD/phage-associated family protein